MTEIIEFDPPFDEDEASVRSRFDTDADPSLDKREGSFYQLLTEPSVKESARLWASLNDVVEVSSALYAYGIYLDYKAEENGLTRKPANKAEGQVAFTGTNGTVIPAATRVAVPGITGTDPVIRFVTTAEVTISGGTATANIEADQAGESGNVDAGAINTLEDVIAGVASVTNALETTGGADEESDDELRDRLLLEINSPQAAGSASDYVRWALTIPGVVEATCIPVWEGPNTVKVVVLGAGNTPASQSVMDDVQEYLTGAPVLGDPSAAPTVATGAAGALTGTFYYRVTFIDVEDCETKTGPASASVSPAAQQVSLTAIPIGGAGVTGRRIYRSTSATGVFRFVAELADNVTTTYTDNDSDISTEREAPKTNNTTDYLGQAPIGARVSVDTATQVPIDVVATVATSSGYSLDGSGGTIDITPQIEAALEAYIDTLVPGDDVIYNSIKAAFFTVTGVYDISAVTIEGGSSNVAIASSQIASLGTVTLS